jgi:hypothetical protein
VRSLHEVKKLYRMKFPDCVPLGISWSLSNVSSFALVRYVFCAALLAGASLVETHAQQETIPEAIARGATGRFRTAPSGVAPSFDEVLKNTDLIVRGFVGEHRSYLSSDQTNIYTEYELRNISVLHQSRPFAAGKPGAQESLTVKQLGGTVRVNGVAFTQIEDGLPPLTQGSEALFLLTRTPEGYVVAGKFYGAFGIQDGKLVPLTKVGSFAPEYRNNPVAEDIAKIVAQARAVPK